MSSNGRSTGATIYAVAQRAGVSAATVSRALRDDPRITPATRASVHQAAKALHYLPRAAARALAHNKTSALGLVLPHIDGSYYADLLVGFETAASAKGLSVIITLANPSQDCRAAVRTLAAQVDGVAFMARSAATDELVTEIARSRPVVTAARQRVEDHDAFFIESRSTARQLTQHLLDQGRRRLAFLGTPERGGDLGERHLGYSDAMTSAGLDLTTLAVFPSEEEGRRVAEELVTDGLPCDGLVCGNDELALAVMQTLQERGVRIPDDVAITGWDDTVTARYVRPGLTTVSQPVRRLGELAAQQLFNRIEEDTAPIEASNLEASIMHRASCGCTESTNPLQARSSHDQPHST